MAPPPLNIPKSQNVVSVSCINTTTNMITTAELLAQPVIPGYELWNMRTFAFLIENPKTGRKILFDCGARKDWWNLSPPVVKAIVDTSPALQVEKGVHEILEEGGTDLSTIDHIVWSHWHWDHTGDPSKHPKSTSVVVGPGFKMSFLPGFPVNPKSPVLATDFEGREVIEVEFNKGVKIGRYNAIDFLGDGSFYILDVPGHAIGHISGLARVTPDTFIFMGGDVCHHGGSFRPTEWKPIPSPMPSSAVLDARFRLPCPCSIFTDVHPANAEEGEEAARRKPFLRVTQKEGGWYTFPQQAQESIDNLTEFDASDDVFVAIAHDSGMLDVIDFYPKGVMDEWKAKGWKDKAHWGFMSELPVEGGPMPPLVNGIYKDGKMMRPLMRSEWVSKP